MNTLQQLRTAYETAKAGDRPRARQLIKEILEVEPNNDAAWYLYARIAENRQKSIYCLEKVQKINPSHVRAGQDLKRFKNEGGISKNLQTHNLYSQTEQRRPKTQHSTKLPVWIWILVAGFASVIAIACLGYIIFSGALLPNTQPSGPSVAQPLVFSTPTNDCSCILVTGYLDKTFSRVDTISTQIISIESAYEDGNLWQFNFTAFSSEAKTIYKEQLGETPPSCLQTFQNKTISLLWNWQQTMEYVASGQYNAVDVFFQGFMDDFSALESEGKRLLQEELNGCVVDPSSEPNL